MKHTLTERLLLAGLLLCALFVGCSRHAGRFVDGVVFSVEVTPTNPSIASGTTQPFRATGVFRNGTTRDLTNSVAWSFSNPGVATLSNAPGSSGLTSGLTVGSTLITAIDPATGLSGSTTLWITAAVLMSIDVTPTYPSIALGTT